MTENSLVPRPFDYHDRSELRLIFKQYLQTSDRSEKLSWHTITSADGLPHNWIYDLFQDSQERIWVSTWGGGLACFDGQHWRSFSTRDGLHCNEVTCIREDADGAIWIATDQGLNRIEGVRILDAGLTGKSLLNLTFDQNGNLWVGCWRAARSGGGLFRFDGHSWQSFSTRTDLPGLEILKVFNDSHGRIWIGTYEQGLGAGVGCYDGQRWRSYTTAQGLVNNCVYSMFEDPQGNMWFGTLSGISIFDGSNWHTLTSHDGLVDDRIYCMLIDSTKKMWFGTEGGVSRFDGNNWLTFTKQDGLVEELVRTIIETSNGDLWFGTYPYARGAGGISIASYDHPKSLTDRILDLLPPPSEPKRLQDGNQ